MCLVFFGRQKPCYGANYAKPPKRGKAYAISTKIQEEKHIFLAVFPYFAKISLILPV